MAKIPSKERELPQIVSSTKSSTFSNQISKTYFYKHIKTVLILNSFSFLYIHNTSFDYIKWITNNSCNKRSDCARTKNIVNLCIFKQQLT